MAIYERSIPANHVLAVGASSHPGGRLKTYEGQHNPAVVSGPSSMQYGAGQTVKQDEYVAATVQPDGHIAGLSKLH
jgi:hypothetical protein